MWFYLLQRKCLKLLLKVLLNSRLLKALYLLHFLGLYTVGDVQGINHTFYLSSNKNNKFIKTKQIFKTNIVLSVPMKVTGNYGNLILRQWRLPQKHRSHFRTTVNSLKMMWVG